MPATEHITSGYIGQDISLVVSVTEGGANKDLSAATAIAFTLDTPTEVTKSLGAGIVVSAAPSAHQLTVTIDAADTSGQAAGRYEYQIWVTDVGSLTAPVTVGELTLLAAL